MLQHVFIFTTNIRENSQQFMYVRAGARSLFTKSELWNNDRLCGQKYASDVIRLICCLFVDLKAKVI